MSSDAPSGGNADEKPAAADPAAAPEGTPDAGSAKPEGAAKPNYTPPVRPAGSAPSAGHQQQAAQSAPADAGSEMSAEKAIGLAFVGGFVAARMIRRFRG